MPLNWAVRLLGDHREPFPQSGEKLDDMDWGVKSRVEDQIARMNSCF